MSTTVKLDSKIFDKGLRRTVISSAIAKSAKVFKEATRRRMVESRASGKNYPKRRGGKGFNRFHRASRRGERPAPDTLTLVNALEDNRTGEFAVTVEVGSKINPENGENAREYAERLQGSMDRPIMNRDDARIAQSEMNYRMNKVIGELT